MFLISAHQTYMNHKFLKKRLESNCCHNNSRHNPKEEEEKELNCLLKYNSNKLNFLFKVDHNSGLTSRFTNNYQQVDETEESTQMQRTKKYFTSNGHKFLFNNT